MDGFLSLGSAFLGGCLVAAIGYSMAFIGRVNRMESKLDSLTVLFEDHKKAERQCPFHSKVEKDIAVLQVEVANDGHAKVK
jgi:ATP-dependent RNA circularization protein (DNA/RNA ligase family)